jgi:putative ABC transport system permease protein
MRPPNPTSLWSRRLARAVDPILRFRSPGFAHEYGAEIAASLATLLAWERQRAGRLAMLVLWMRALGDAWRAAQRARRMDVASGGPRWPLHDLGADVRRAGRAIRRTPAFSLTVVLTLASGLGLASAIFAFADGYLLRPMPFGDPHELFLVRAPDQRREYLRASEADALRAGLAGRYGFVSGTGSSAVGFAMLELGGRRVPVLIGGISEGFGEVTRVKLAFGRYFTPDEHRLRDVIPIWLTYRFFQREFGGSADILGRRLVARAGTRAMTIEVVGVTDPSVTTFDTAFGANNELEAGFAPALPREPDSGRFVTLATPIVRLPRGVSRERAETEIAAALQAIAPRSDGAPRRARLDSWQEEHGKAGRPTARLLITGAALALGLVLVNLVHLLLTRGVARSAEIATRAALGASRWRLSRLFLVESLLYAAGGIAAGLALARWLTLTLAGNLPTRGTDAGTLALVPMQFDHRVVTFAIVMGLAVAIIGGLWPAWRASRVRLVPSTHAPGGPGARVSSKMSRALLASEVAVSTVVLTGAVFAGIGIWRFLNQPLGLDLADRFGVAFPAEVDAREDGVDWIAMRDAVRDVEGVRAASAVFESSRDRVRIGDQTLDRNAAGVLELGIDGAQAIGFQILAGRMPTAAESIAVAPVALVDERFVRTYWPDRSAVGQRLAVGDAVHDVIGVIATPKFSLLKETPPLVVVPAAPRPQRTGMTVWAPGVSERELTDRLIPVVSALAPGFRPRVSARTFDRLFDDDIANVRFQRPIVLVLGLFAFSVAGIGLFGVVAYLVEQRTRDFGVLLALGAKPSDICVALARQCLRPAAIGLVLGLTGALALSGVMRAGMFGWESSAPLSMTAVSVLMLVVAIVAVIAPARRVLRIDPSVTLRAE